MSPNEEDLKWPCKAWVALGGLPGHCSSSVSAGMQGWQRTVRNCLGRTSEGHHVLLPHGCPTGMLVSSVGGVLVAELCGWALAHTILPCAVPAHSSCAGDTASCKTQQPQRGMAPGEAPTPPWHWAHLGAPGVPVPTLPVLVSPRDL